tara:strand:- start:357 stop:992 length:636 start_codon:yes stop_codon:yes gene_type:complete
MELLEGENTGLVILQILIVILAFVIIILLFSERSTTNNIDKKIKEFKIPTCPKCPDCNCTEEGCPSCPDCVCPESGSCPSCPRCPNVNTSCPEHKTVTIEDITDAIFPGRNKGITSHGQYFPLDGLGEGMVEPAYSPVTNLMPNYVGGAGVPASISFADQTLLNNKSSIGLAAEKSQPVSLATTQGVFSNRNTLDQNPSPMINMDASIPTN